MGIVLSDLDDHEVNVYLTETSMTGDDLADLRLEISDLHDFAKMLADTLSKLKDRVNALEAQTKQ
jgi:vacuolar-type H+-ATPase subunit D/Vma8